MPQSLVFFKGLLVFVLMIVLTKPVQATHIVGGDIEMTYLRDSRYLLALNLFNDDINGEPNAIDIEVELGIYQKGTPNSLVMTVLLSNPSRTPLPYQNPSCSNGNLRTSIVRYERVISLLPSVFNNPNGYFVAWQRCCRNQIIDNIFEPEATGMTFYLEFPAVNPLNGGYLNSSPKFNVTEGDYACLGRPFTFDFGATDADGDQLQYRLVTPYAGTVDNIVPFMPPLSGLASTGYMNTVRFRPGYTFTTAIPSLPQMDINPLTGKLSFVATELGLFVLAVEVAEFRDGVQIGLARREFQIMVLNCPTYSPPTATLYDDSPIPQPYNEGDTIFVNTLEGACVTFKVSDNDAFDVVKLEAIPVNFQTNKALLEKTRIEFGNRTGEIDVELCSPGCEDVSSDGLYAIDVVLTDNSCPRPLRDTIRYLFYILSPENNPPNKPIIITPGYSDSLYAELTTGERLQLQIAISDPDSLDKIRLELFGDPGIRFSDLGLSLDKGFQENPTIINVDWVTNCSSINQVDENGLLRVYMVSFDDQCRQLVSDTNVLVLKLKDIVYEQGEFEVYNVVTPNNDGRNDVWRLPNLPLNSCRDGDYVGIELYNRWGRKVFETEDRDFRWEPDVPAGFYFYLINYTSREYKGWLNVIR